MTNDNYEGGKYRFDFPLQPETVIEAAESLSQSEDAYDRYLAAELKDGYDRCDGDLSEYSGIAFADSNHD